MSVPSIAQQSHHTISVGTPLPKTSSSSPAALPDTPSPSKNTAPWQSQLLYTGVGLQGSLKFMGQLRTTQPEERTITALLTEVNGAPPNLDHSVAVVDLGGNTLRVLILDPDQTLHDTRWYVDNGLSIGRTTDGHIDDEAWTILQTSLEELRDYFKAHNIQNPEHVLAVTTGGIRSASNSEEIMERMRGISVEWTGADVDPSPINFQMIDGKTEGAWVYPAVLVGEGLPADAPMIVLEIGGATAEVVFGTGPNTVNDKWSKVIEMGLSRLNLADPYDPDAIAQAHERAEQAINATITPDDVTHAQGRRMFIREARLALLNQVHQAVHGEQADLARTPLTHELVKYYLTPEGLEHIKAQTDPINDASQIKKLVATLILLDILMEKMTMPSIELGYGGGLSFGLLSRIVKEQSCTENP